MSRFGAKYRPPMIPKTVHSFWFGKGPLPELAVRSMSSWRAALPGFEIKLWDEDSYDVGANAFTRDAYRTGRLAYVSDYARLDVLRRFGGVYLDVDVEVRKSFAPLLHHGVFLGFMYDCNLGTAVVGARPGHALLDQLLARFRETVDPRLPNNDIFTRHFLEHYPSFRLNNQRQELGDVVIYPKEYFEFPRPWGDGGYSVHHFLGNWWREHSIAGGVKSVAKALGGKPGYWALRSLTHQRALWSSPFRQRYLADR